MKNPGTSDYSTFRVAQLAAAISIASFFYYLRHGDLLLYGDAVAHIDIARRVFDSRTPGLLQLGTVWLPLPHILMLPFLVSRWMWQTGIGGSIPSLIAYVFSVTGIFRLMRTVIPSRESRSEWDIQFAAWLAAAIFALNPNVIYLQTTAMTEPVYLALFIWTVGFFSDAIRGCAAGETRKANSSLVNCSFCLFGACLTRYDGWLLAAVVVATASSLAWLGNFAPLRPGVKKLVLLAVAAPLLWLAYNAAVYGNPLEFANGPYSAKAIELRTAVPGMPPHPGTNDLSMAFKYFFKSAQLTLGEHGWQIFWVSALLIGTGIVVLFQRKLWPLPLLWTPVPFYMLSIAVFTAIAAYGLIRFVPTPRAKVAVATVFSLVATASYFQVFRSGAVSFQEAEINSRTRIALETQLAASLKQLPPNSTFVMYLGDHVGAFQQAGIPLSRVINEGNHRPWKRPADPDGLWEKALQHPAAYADFVVTFDSDVVASTIEKRELQAIEIVRVSGQPEATLYRTLKTLGIQSR